MAESRARLQDPRQPGGRGARPGRPSQRFRETSRSFERLAEQLGDLRESETRLKHDLDDASYKVDDLNKLIATRDAEIAQLQPSSSRRMASFLPGTGNISLC